MSLTDSWCPTWASLIPLPSFPLSLLKDGRMGAVRRFVPGDQYPILYSKCSAWGYNISSFAFESQALVCPIKMTSVGRLLRLFLLGVVGLCLGCCSWSDLLNAQLTVRYALIISQAVLFKLLEQSRM